MYIYDCTRTPQPLMKLLHRANSGLQYSKSSNVSISIKMHFTTLLASALAATLTSAHPGHDIAAEIAEREVMLNQMSHRSLEHCAEEIKRSGLEARAVARRNALAERLMKERGLVGESAGQRLDDASTC